MFTAQERCQRAMVILQDAFEAQPSYLAQAEDDPEVWTGDIITDQTFIITIVARESAPTVTIILKDEKGVESRVTAGTYDDLASWVYDMSRRYEVQDWISPRHFAHLVSRILSPITYNPSWPHEHRLQLKDGREMSFCWDEDMCRLRVQVGRGDPTYFRHPGDAVGWLTRIQMGLV